MERELDVLPQHWEQIILKIRQNLERNEEESAQISATGEWARWLGRAWHKKSTIELLLRGRLASRSGGQRASQTDNGEQHNFQKYNFTTPEHCHVCNRVLWGIMKQGKRILTDRNDDGVDILFFVCFFFQDFDAPFANSVAMKNAPRLRRKIATSIGHLSSAVVKNRRKILRVIWVAALIINQRVRKKCQIDREI